MSTRKGRDFHAEEDALDGGMAYLMYVRGWGLAHLIHKNTERSRFVDVAHGEMVEKQLDALIQRRARKGDVDPDEAERYLAKGA